MFPLYSIVLLVAGSLGSCHPQQCHSNSTHIQEDKISLLSLATQHNHTSKTGWAHQAINGNHPICLVGCTLHIKYVYIYIRIIFLMILFSKVCIFVHGGSDHGEPFFHTSKETAKKWTGKFGTTVSNSSAQDTLYQV